MKSLPEEITKILKEKNAQGRLVRHLEIVHQTADLLLEAILRIWPNIKLNTGEILFGAASHDVGKVIVTNELYDKGSKHTQDGYRLLLKYGFTHQWARFALLHEDWNDKERTLEEQLVSLSDNIWCGRRIDELEELVGQKIALLLGVDYWTVYPELDTILTELEKDSEKRLFYQKDGDSC